MKNEEKYKAKYWQLNLTRVLKGHYADPWALLTPPNPPVPPQATNVQDCKVVGQKNGYVAKYQTLMLLRVLELS